MGHRTRSKRQTGLETRSPARQRVLDTAMEMFYREGARAVGVDAVVARAGVCKMSLYRAFPSKDDLIVAFLEEASRHFWEWWDMVMARCPDDPRGQLREMFESLARRTTSANFRGCPFVNTAVEFPDPAHPGRAVVAKHRSELRARLRGLAEGVGARDADVLADQLLLLMEGAYAAGSVMPGESAAPAVVSAAEALITTQLS